VPSTYTGVKFDEKGVCSVCKEWDKLWKGYNFRGRAKEFTKLFRNKKGKYDCIVPFSGGKDSSYVLYYLQRKLGLTPLAVNLNNHFQTDIIKKNIGQVTHQLGVDMISFSPGFSNWCELMR
jgi:tRNA(Ile)-lysidine synthase TilS/MesJ